MLEVPEVIRCVLLRISEGRLYLLEVLVMRRVLLCMLEALEVAASSGGGRKLWNPRGVVGIAFYSGLGDKLNLRIVFRHILVVSIETWLVSSGFVMVKSSLCAECSRKDSVAKIFKVPGRQRRAP